MQKHSIVPTSYGGFTPIAAVTERVKSLLKEGEVKDSPVKLVLPDICGKMATASGKPVSDTQILELWLKQKGFGIVTYVHWSIMDRPRVADNCARTSTKVERVKEYVAAFGLPALSAEDVQAIDEAGAKLHHRRFVRRLWRLLTLELLFTIVFSCRTLASWRAKIDRRNCMITGEEVCWTEANVFNPACCSRHCPG